MRDEHDVTPADRAVGALLGLAAVLAVVLALVLPTFLLLVFGPVLSSGWYRNWALPVALLVAGGAVTGLWRAWAAMRRGERGRAVAWCTPFAAALAVAIPLKRALTHANALYWQERIAEEVLVTSDLDAPIYFYDSDQCILVYGCSLAIFELPAALEQRFRGPSAHDPEHRLHVPERWGKRYNAIAWTGTPIAVAYMQHLDFVLAQDSRVRDAQVLPYVEQIRGVTSRPGNYLGWIYRSGGSSEFSEFMDVDLLAIDLDGRRILFARRYWQR